LQTDTSIHIFYFLTTPTVERPWRNLSQKRLWWNHWSRSTWR